MAITHAMLPCFKELDGGRFIHKETLGQKTLQLSCLALVIFKTQEVCMGEIDDESFTGVDFVEDRSSLWSLLGILPRWRYRMHPPTKYSKKIYETRFASHG